jgi:hypothetical protein
MQPRLRFARSLLVLFAAALTAAAFEDKPAGEAQKASIEGVVVDGASGAPVKECPLMLIGTGRMRAPVTATTGTDGKFAFKDLDGGSYVLLATHPRYARQTYGSRDGRTGTTPISVNSGQAVKQITFKLQPNSVISGKVVDEDGEPVQGVSVGALRPAYQRGHRMYVPAGMATTNDLGEYRIASLAAGRYLVSATPPRNEQAAPPDGQPITAYIPTYYPNGNEASAAAPVNVTSGGDTSGIDIKLLKSKAVRLRGKVLGMKPGSRAGVRLAARSEGLLAMINSRSATPKAADGSFEFAAVPPGSYTLRAMASSMRAQGPAVSVEVGERPIDDLVVELPAPMELRGRIVVEGDGDQKPSLSGLTVYLEGQEAMALLGGMARPAEDGGFQMKDIVAGRYYPRLMPVPEGCYLRTVTLGSARLGDDGLEIPASAGGGMLEFRLAPTAATVEGTVQDGEGNPAAGMTVVLVPESHAYALYQTAPSDQNGAFRMKNIPPGIYRLFAWQEVEPGIYYDPEFVKPLESAAEKLVLTDSDRRTVTVKVIPKN